jgi:hypothetical protein
MRRIALVAVATSLFAAAAVRADCVADCSSQYDAAMAACQQANPDPSQANAMQSCMDQAQQSYGQCVDACGASQ